MVAKGLLSGVLLAGIVGLALWDPHVAGASLLAASVVAWVFVEEWREQR